MVDRRFNVSLRCGPLALSALLCVSLLGGRAGAQGYKPGEAAGKMTAADGLTVELVASEPEVRQPVAINFDDRGRLWVIQYLQYPNPAGLERVSVDRYSRTEYDQVPPPPPQGPRGDDRITILEDTNGDGRFDGVKDFVAGLNLASGLAFGSGGVYVLQAPYLLFYPDRDGDDIPDSDPEALLTGFGLQDAHSVANSLTWGPDGWLYGLQGSTVTARIGEVEFQQGLWRYHPPTRRFELFCEGGGNMWGLDFDPQGQAILSTNVGGHTMLHAVQGAYYWKQFGKHGPLHNRFALGFFDHVACPEFRGGHVSVGGQVYQGGALPERFHGAYLYGNLLSHSVLWQRFEPRGSTFVCGPIHDFALSNDTWFAPCALATGPDGAIYVADWHDRRTAHPDPDADWDRSNGRIFRIQASQAERRPAPNLMQQTSQELVALLSHPNVWYRRRAQRILAERGEASVADELRATLFDVRDVTETLARLWTLHALGAFDEQLAIRLLEHPSEHVRYWSVRLLGDRRAVSDSIGEKLVQMAASDESILVCSQLASSAQRLDAATGLAIVAAIVARDHEAICSDDHLPLLCWWGLEAHAMQDVSHTVQTFAQPALWDNQLARETILPKLMTRLAGDGSRAGQQGALALLRAAPDAASQREMLDALDFGLAMQATSDSQSRKGTLFDTVVQADGAEASAADTAPLAVEIDAGLRGEIRRRWTDAPDDLLLLKLACRLGVGEAPHRAAVTIALDKQRDAGLRIGVLRLLALFADSNDLPKLLPLVGADEPEELQAAALVVLGRFDDRPTMAALLERYPRLTPKLRQQVRQSALARPESAATMLRRVDEDAIPAADFTLDELRVVRLHENPELDQIVVRHWGSVSAGTPEGKLAEMRRLSNDLRAEPGDVVRGAEVYARHCANCHRLHGQGHNVGPDLTHANRQDRTFLLQSLVDPNAAIRREFVSHVVQTRDGRVLTGLIGDQTPASLTLVEAENKRTVIARDEIEELRESTVSLMPEDLYRRLSPEELRDLFRYLESPGPASAAESP